MPGPLDHARARLAHAAHDAGIGQQVTVSADDLAAVLNAFPDLDLPEPEKIGDDGRGSWHGDDWDVWQEADGSEWVHVHVQDERGLFYGNSYTFAPEVAAAIGAAAVRPIPPGTEYEPPF